MKLKNSLKSLFLTIILALPSFIFINLFGHKFVTEQDINIYIPTILGALTFALFLSTKPNLLEKLLSSAGSRFAIYLRLIQIILFALFYIALQSGINSAIVIFFPDLALFMLILLGTMISGALPALFMGAIGNIVIEFIVTGSNKEEILAFFFATIIGFLIYLATIAQATLVAWYFYLTVKLGGKLKSILK